MLLGARKCQSLLLAAAGAGSGVPQWLKNHTIQLTETEIFLVIFFQNPRMLPVWLFSVSSNVQVITDKNLMKRKKSHEDSSFVLIGFCVLSFPYSLNSMCPCGTKGFDKRVTVVIWSLLLAWQTLSGEEPLRETLEKAFGASVSSIAKTASPGAISFSCFHLEYRNSRIF